MSMEINKMVENYVTLTEQKSSANNLGKKNSEGFQQMKM